MENPKISVIIPAYNVEPYLKQCIESVLHQTMQDIEIILVNDGSTDRTLEIMNAYGSLDQVTIISQKNAGLSASRNNGMKLARGKYIYFLDSDDYIEEDFLGKAYVRMEQYQLDQLIVNEREFNDGAQDKIIYTQLNHDYSGVMSGKEAFVALNQNNEYMACAQYRVIRRQFLLEYNLEFYAGIIHEDELFSFQLMMRSQRCMICRDIYYYMRMRAESITHAVNHEKKWTGMQVVIAGMLADDQWADAAAEQKHYIYRWIALMVRIALVSFYGMERRYRTMHQKEYEQLLQQMVQYDYLEDSRIRKICCHRRLYAIYQEMVKLANKIRCR